METGPKDAYDSNLSGDDDEPGTFNIIFIYLLANVLIRIAPSNSQVAQIYQYSRRGSRNGRH